MLTADPDAIGPETVEIPAELRIAVLIPCYNEEQTIAPVIADFQAALPQAHIYVYDNNSSDRSVAIAAAAGATVRKELRQGKGHVVRRMFTDIEADLYVLVDADATYDAPSAGPMIAHLLQHRLDMLVAVRVEDKQAAYRTGHRTGNRLLTGFVAHVFGQAFSDMLSGYRVFTRRFVKSFPGLSGGFEIETELTVHALELGLPVGEWPTPYYARPDRLAVQTEYLDRRPAHLEGNRATVSLGTAIAVLWRHRRVAGDRIDWPRHPDFRHLFRDRVGSTLSHGDPVDRIDGDRRFVGGVRADPRHGDARTARVEAARLSVAARARGRAPNAGVIRCANSSAPMTPFWSPPSRRC